MEIKVKNIGKIVEGHVLDVRKDLFERALKNYDDQLYLKWNCHKNNGNGCWELRRKPNKKTAVFKTEYLGSKVFELEYVESDLIHHVLDIPYLNYEVLNRLREMDAWAHKDWLAHQDYLAEKRVIQEEKKIEDNQRLLIKENRKYFRELQEYVRSGYNPAYFFSGRYSK